MSFPAYPDYKDSGVPWLGEVPAHWRTERLKALFELQKRPVRPEDEIVTAFRDGIVTLRKNRREDGFTNALQEIGYQGIRRGDLVIHAMDGFAGAIGVSDADGKSTPVYSVCRPKAGTSAHYYGRLLRHMALSGFVNALARGVRERSTEFRWSDASVLHLPVPPEDEQFAINAFLDQETAKIDALVAEQERLIALLKEKRQAVISHAVTKGLNPHAPMKDSGIEWLGKIPAHWTLTRTSRHFKLGMGETILSADLTDDGPWPVFSATEGDHYFGRLANPRLQLMEGDLVIPARGNSIGHVKLAWEPCTATQTTIYARILDRTEISPDFAYWFMRGLKKWLFPFVQTAIPQITTAEIGANIVVIPDQSEQIEIVKHVKAVVERFELLIAEAQAAITLLQERRAALISAAVTGKIDVRGLVDAPATAELETA